MSDIIHLLPDHIANQIAAGEVIQRPASAVKELIENSIDAGAKNITVNIRDAGKTLIQIIDDGKGMSETDARMAFERHATSKIATVDDLFSLRTMGFRGEALASIAAVSQVELRTRIKGGDIGTCLTVAGSQVEDVSAIACNEGSIFSIKNLFFNVPARRKFLKSNETEFRHITLEFERVALACPEIAFTLKHNDSEVFNLMPSVLKQRIIDLFGKSLNYKLLSIEAETSLVKIKGFVSNIDAMKRTTAQQFFFVNGRYMRHPYFHRAVMQAYEKLIQPGGMPDYFIYFTVDPTTIDVNIHPTKTEIKFENERPVWQVLTSSVRESLARTNAVPTIDFDNRAEMLDIPVFNPQSERKAPALQTSHDYNPFERQSITDDWKKLYEGFENSAPSMPLHETIYSEAEAEKSGSFFCETASPCFQYKNRYIITSLKSGLVIVDQHRAHVRVLYERYMKNMKKRSAVSQKLIFPEIIDLTAAEKALTVTLSEELRSLGFELEFMGGNSYSINGVPADISDCHPADLIREIFNATIDEGVSGLDRVSERLALSLARTAAIRAGKMLTPDEMEQLIAALFALENNGLTPDGLPTLTLLSDDELAKRL
jgi:DNA mismatch repair protein MutL